VNVDRRCWGASVRQLRIFAAGIVLLAAGCAIFAGSFHPHDVAGKLAAAPISGSNLLPTADATAEAHAQAAVKARSLFAGLPLIFEPNQGQANLDPSDARARFMARGSGYSLFLGSQGATLSLVAGRSNDRSIHSQNQVHVNSLEMKLAGANPRAVVTGSDSLPGKSNYFIGNDPAKWRSGVPQFARVRYENIYPGINLVFYGNQGHLEYDFQIAPGADPAQAELQFNGAKRLELQDGALVIHTAETSVRLEAPRVYQDLAGKRQPVHANFDLRGHDRAGFSLGHYDRSRELIIDPILSFSSYFGGTGDEAATSIAVDGSFNIYLTGSTTSPGLPAAGNLQGNLAGTQNLYIAKITPPLGSIVAALDFVSYLGGGGVDSPVGIKVDGSGDAFVAGTTTSGLDGTADFPTTPTTAYQTTPEPGSVGTSHVFVSALRFDGKALLYSSYLSGNNTDAASGMTIDASGFVYVTGTTQSTDAASTTDQFPASTLPQALPFQISPRAPTQFFVTKVNTNAPRTGSIAYSTYFGGGSFPTGDLIADGGGIAVDTNGNIYFTGTTNFSYSGQSQTTDFPILNAYQPCINQPPTTVIIGPVTCGVSPNNNPDAFVAKLNPNAAQGQQLVWSTYVGGTGTDSSLGVALDPGAANAYIIGTTNSTDIASSVTSLSTSAAYQHCLDTPSVTSGTCPTPAGSPPASDAFVARLSNPTSTTGTATNVTLSYFSYLGGSADEKGLAIVVDSGSGALLTGWTQSPDFPTLNCGPLQCGFNATQDAFIARINTVAVTGQGQTASWASYFGGHGLNEGTGIALDVNQNAYLAGDTNAADLRVAEPLPAAEGGSYNGGTDSFAAQLGSALSLSISGVLTIGQNQTYISAGNQATFTYTITNNGPDLANTITVTDNLNPSVTGVPLTFVSATFTGGVCGGASTGESISCNLQQLQSGSTATLTIVVTPTATSGGSQATFNGGTVQVMGPGNIVLAQTSVPALMSDYTMSVSPNNQTIAAAGDTAPYTVQLTPHPIYATSVSLSCSNLPTGAACNFTNSPATLNSTSGITSTLNITTQPRPIVTGSLLVPRFYAIWLLVPGLAFLGAGFRTGRRRFIAPMMLGLLFGLLLLLPACSHTAVQPPVAGTPAGNYTITVTATAGSDVKSRTVTLQVP